MLEDFEGFAPIYSRCPETGLRVCEISKNVLVREDGMVRNVNKKAHNSIKNWYCGVDNGVGYFTITKSGNKSTQLKVHRLVAMAFIPRAGNIVDHINGNKSDNVVSNLRWGTRRNNNQNTIKHRQGKLVGVAFEKRNRCKPWFAKIKTKGVTTYLGYFHTEQEAHEAYVKALKELGESLPTLPEHSKKPSP